MVLIAVEHTDHGILETINSIALSLAVSQESMEHNRPPELASISRFSPETFLLRMLIPCLFCDQSFNINCDPFTWNPVYLYKIGQIGMYRYVLVRTGTRWYKAVHDFQFSSELQTGTSQYKSVYIVLEQDSATSGN
jgi:hypothetical protein